MDNNNNNVVWLVHSFAVNTIRANYVFNSKDKAVRKYNDIMNYFTNHAPDDIDGLRYNLLYEHGKNTDMAYSVFESKNGSSNNCTFAVYYCQLPIE